MEVLQFVAEYYYHIQPSNLFSALKKTEKEKEEEKRLLSVQ